MANTLFSKGDESQSSRCSLLYDRTPNPLSFNNSTVHTSDISSMSPFFGSLDFPEKHVEGLSGCSSSYPSEASPSRWQLSNQNSKTYFSSNKTSENSFSTPAQSNFTCKTFDSGRWKQTPDPTISYIAQISQLLPTSKILPSPSEATETSVTTEGSMLRELLGRLGSNHRNSNITPRETTLPAATGSTHHLCSPMTSRCSWNDVDDASRNIALAADLSNAGLIHEGIGLAASHGLSHFSSEMPAFARMSSLSNVSSSGGAVNMSLSSEAASHFVEISNIQASMTPGGATPQSSPKVIRHKNPSHKLSTCENASKMGSNIHDLVVNERTAAEDSGDGKRLRSGACHSVVTADETKPLQNSVIPANSSSSGQYAAMHGLIPNKGLVVDTHGNTQQNCISGEKAKEISCLSETSKQKMDHEVRSKRHRTSEVSKVKEEPKAKVERSCSDNSGNSSPSSAKENPKPPEPPKQDYIHVRARRGQATDSHSLAERVRREKISERMKFLQDLVPGCSKVTGKALMLDEIINYVQSLQHQVEFLSMKLAAVNPRLDFNFESLLSKEILSSLGPFPTSLLGADNSTSLLQLNSTQQSALQLGLSCGLDLRPFGTPIENHFERLSGSPVPVHMHANSGSQASGVWDGELQSVVQMGSGSGSFTLGQLKAEL